MSEVVPTAAALWRLLGRSAMGVAITDATGHFLHANPAYCRLVGYEETELRRMTFAHLTHPSDHDRNARLYEELLGGERKAFVTETRYKHRDGHDVWARLNVSLEHGDVGEILVIATAENVTLERALTEQLADHELLLRNAARVAGLGTWDADLVSGSVSWSPETYALLGVTEDAFAGTVEAFMALVHSDDRQRLREAHAISLVGDAPFEARFRIARPDGHVRTMYERGEVVRNDTGVAVRRFGVIQDVTEAEAIFDQLQESETRFRLLSRATTDAIWDWNVGSDTLWWSDGFAALFGVSMPAPSPTRAEWAYRVHPDDRASVLGSLRKALDGGVETWTAQYRFTRSDRTIAEVLDRGYIIRDASGQATRMIGGMTDISSLRASEREVTEQALLLEQATDAIILRDLQLNVQRWNHGAERLYGRSSAAALGRPLADAASPLASVHRKAMAAVLETGEWSDELLIQRPSGEQSVVLSRWSRLDDAGGAPRAVLTIETDITDRKTVEAQLLRSQRLESIGTLAGGIAHDLNNVLAPILLSIELLRLDATDDSTREILETIEQSALRGTDMVRQVLSFARGVEGRRLAVNASQLMAELARVIRETFPRGIELFVDIAPDLPAILGDPTQVHQILLNLCVNARDAMPDGGTLRLAARTAEVDAHYAGMEFTAREGRYVLLEVADTGGGIDPAVRERIFEPFFTTKAAGQGTGLGLSTTLAIIRSHGGFLRVDSDVGVGTRFEVFLPASEDASVEYPASSPALRRGSGELILVVDDEAPIREITQKTLEAFGYRVLTASEGSEAIALLVQHRDTIQLVVTDLLMPGMDGAATIPVLRHLAPRLPILVASGEGGVGGLARALAYGATSVVAKPFTASALLESVWSALMAVQDGRVSGTA